MRRLSIDQSPQLVRGGAMRYLVIDILVLFMMLLVAYGIYLRGHTG